MKRWTAVGLGILGASVAVRRLWRSSERSGVAFSMHQSQTAASYRAAPFRVLILGAGFGGLATALALDRRLGDDSDTSVLLVDRNNDQLFTPLLWTVAGGRANPNDIVVPIRSFQRHRRFHVLHAEVERIDLDRKEVETSAGPRPYDVLVIGLGSITALPNLPGIHEYVHVFHTPADALQLRNHLIDALENAHQASDPDERRAWLTFVVCGGGDTGIELAAIIHAYLTTTLLAEYPWLSDEPVRVVLVGRADRLVPMSTPRTSETVRAVLEQEGIEVRTGESVEAVTADAVKTSAGEIAARTVFWAAGITAVPAVQDLPVDHARNGALIVDDRLRLPNHPNVYVVGDSAWAFDAETKEAIPPTAQAAEHAGAYIAAAIAAERAGQPVPPFHFAPRGHLALLGRATGVANVGRFTFTGRPAWLVWHAYYLSHMPDWDKRIRLFTAWIQSAIFGGETGQLRLGGPSKSSQLSASSTLPEKTARL